MSGRADVEVVLVRGESRLLGDALADALSDARPIRLSCAPLDEAEAPRAVASLHPNVVLLDAVGWSCERVADVVGRLVAAWGLGRVLVLASPRAWNRCMVAAVEAGASAVLTPRLPVARLRESILAVSRGERLIDAAHYLRVVEDTARLREVERDARERLASLTAREREVLGCLAEGLRTDETARRLGVSVRTVGTHVHNLLGKLNVRTRVEAVSLALRSPVRPVELRDSA